MKAKLRNSTLRWAAIGASFALMAAACGQNGSSNDGASNDPVRIAWQPGTEGRFYAAQALEIFDEVGMETELIRFNDGPAMNGALQSDAVDIAYIGLPGLLIAAAAEVDVKAFAVENRAARTYGLVAKPESGIDSVEDLVGKSVGTVEGTSAWIGMRKTFEDMGIDPADVTIRNLKVSAMVPALDKDDVDAIWTYAPHVFDLYDVGGEMVISDDELGLDQSAVWIARTDWLDQNPEDVRDYLEVLNRATSEISKDSDKTAEQMSEVLGLSQSVAEKMLDLIEFPPFAEQLADDSGISLTSEDGLARSIVESSEIMHEGGFLDTVIGLEEAKKLIDAGPLQDYVNEGE